VTSLAAVGVNLAITARRASALEQTAQLARSHGVRVLALAGDITDRNHVHTLVNSTIDEFHSIDLLINNAALHTQKRALTTLGADKWDQVVAVNLTAPFDVAREVIPFMRQVGEGLVINIVSTAAFIRDRSQSGVAYGATKAGLAAFTQSIRSEEWEHGIRATAIFPGEIDTAMIGLRPDGTTPKRRCEILKPEDIATAVVFVAQMPARANVSEIVIEPTIERK
jgi:NADP-dependent 3-hydroxy acid dehydrogenase YdfG